MKKLFYSLFALAMTAMTFTSCDDVPMPYLMPSTDDAGGGSSTTVDPLGTGTADDPYNVAAANDYIKDGGDANATVYVKGIVVSVKEIDTSSYGNATYYISDDGTATNQLTVYRGYSLSSAKFTSDTEIKAGDVVVICGKLVNYNGTYEFTQGNYIYSLNGTGGGGGGETGVPSGDGTLDNPYNAAGVLNFISTLAADEESSSDVYIKGKVVTITEQYGTQYGNATFKIADEGAEGTQFTIYRAYYLGNKKYTSGDLLNEGDEVIICGKVVNFKGTTPETVQGKAYLYSLNGTGGGGGTTPSAGEATGSGTLSDPFNAVAANNYANSLADNAKSDANVYIKGKVVSIKEQYGTQYGNATFYISDDGTADNQFYVYRALYLGNKKYTDGDLLKEGDEVIICGKVTKYVGNYGTTLETVTGEAYLYSLNGKTEGSGSSDDPGTTTPTGGNMEKAVSGTTVTLTNASATAGSSVTVDLNDQGWANAAEVTTITLSDGTKITFDKGDGGTTPKFYSATKGVRLYAKNTITISGKAVAKVELACDSYNNTDYVGNDLLFGNANGTTTTIVNEYTGTSGGVQLRVQTITITYAK